jgi:hypothetical protein
MCGQIKSQQYSFLQLRLFILSTLKFMAQKYNFSFVAIYVHEGLSSPLNFVRSYYSFYLY